MSKKRVYVAGPLNADACNYIKNLHKMIRVSEEIRQLGCAVYIPGVDFLQGLVLGTWDYSDYFENSQLWLKVSDIVFFSDGWSVSDGCKREHRTALELDKVICYSIEQLQKILYKDIR